MFKTAALAAFLSLGASATSSETTLYWDHTPKVEAGQLTIDLSAIDRKGDSSWGCTAVLKDFSKKGETIFGAPLRVKIGDASLIKSDKQERMETVVIEVLGESKIDTIRCSIFERDPSDKTTLSKRDTLLELLGHSGLKEQAPAIAAIRGSSLHAGTTGTAE